MILYIHVSVGTVYQCIEVVLAYSVCLIIIITMIEERMGIANL